MLADSAAALNLTAACDLPPKTVGRHGQCFIKCPRPIRHSVHGSAVSLRHPSVWCRDERRIQCARNHKPLSPQEAQRPTAGRRETCVPRGLSSSAQAMQRSARAPVTARPFWAAQAAPPRSTVPCATRVPAFATPSPHTPYACCAQRCPDTTADPGPPDAPFLRPLRASGAGCKPAPLKVTPGTAVAAAPRLP